MNILASQCLATLLLVAVCVSTIHPFHLSTRFFTPVDDRRAGGPFHRASFTINYVSAATCALLLLHFLDIISLEFMASSVVQSGRVQPWSVLTIFFTLAYSSISLDVTGFSKFVALSVLQRYAPEPPRSPTATAVRGGVAAAALDERNRRVTTLSVIVYLLSGVIALLASNDVVVLTLTPVLIHYCQLVRVDPRPVLLAEYFAANTFSSYLLVGNPTNIIIGQGMDMSFAKYLVRLALPTTAVAVASVFSVKFWSGRLKFAEEAGVSAKQRVDGSAAMEDAMKSESPRNLDLDETDGCVSTGPPVAEMSEYFAAMPSGSGADEGRLFDPRSALVDPAGAVYGCVVLSTAILFLVASSYTSIPLYTVTSAAAVLMFCRDCTVMAASPATGGINRIRRSAEVLHRMPWDVAPFAVSMFILVNTMSSLGVTEALSRAVILPILQPDGVQGTLLASSAGFGVALLCMTLLNNQPGSIFFVSLLFPGAASSSSSYSVRSLVDAKPFAAFVTSGILASNVAACFLPTGALAGIMWGSILEAHGVHITFRDFIRGGFRIVALPVAVSACVIFGQSWLIAD